MTNFQELHLSEPVERAVSNMGFEEPTPIQALTIPLAMNGQDLIGRAQTGTGKTAAYGIPLVERCDNESDKLQGLVITPTRELAMQVAEELNRIGQFKGIHTLPIYGGQEIDRQIRALKKHPQIIVGTPGRLMDHMRRRTIRLQQVQMVVLDEADEMLNMGFKEDIESILEQMPEQRQNLLFSATMPPNIQRLAQAFMKDPELIHINPREVTVANIDQEYIEVSESQKLDVLCRLLDIHSPDAAIVFSRTKRRVDEIAEALSKRGYSAEGIHGDMSQNGRDMVMRKFKSGMIEVLVATDVAGRGLDITGVTHVYNLDIPQDAESYVHRIGRTGRAGEKGLALTFVTPRELSHLRYIEQHTRHTIVRRPVPTVHEVMAGLQQAAMESLLAAVGKDENAAYKTLAEALLEDHDSVSLVAAALKMLTREPDHSPVQDLTVAPPIIVRGHEKNRGTPASPARKSNRTGAPTRQGRTKTRSH